MHGQILNLRDAARCRVKYTHTEVNARGSEVGSEFSIEIVAFSGGKPRSYPVGEFSERQAKASS